MDEPLVEVSCERYPLKFLTREGSSDIKAIKEVVERNSYQKPRKGFLIEAGERWVDLGANIGAFTVLAAHLGAEVDAYEADPANFHILQENVRRSGLARRIGEQHFAVVADGQQKAWLSVSEKNKNFWRNSIVKQWKGSRMVQVPCVHFTKVISPEFCVKMDIEGSEMPILESPDFLKLAPKKLVFEWSFDIDKSCDRFRDVMSRLETVYDCDYRPIPAEVKAWPGEWFPAAMTVFCRRK